jgi:phosphopantetheinyl transferase (holo-ACP synthase)
MSKVAVLSIMPNITASQLHFARTELGRPFFQQIHDIEMLPPDFNISHDGDYIAVVSGPVNYKFGIDISKVQNQYDQDWNAFLEPFQSSFSIWELNWLTEPLLLNDRIARFHTLWALKESVVKALGIGMCSDLRERCFEFRDWKEGDPSTLKTPEGARLSIEYFYGGTHQTDWTFNVEWIDDCHVCSTAIFGSPRIPLSHLERVTWKETLEKYA